MNFADYIPHEIEPKWQRYWQQNQTYKVENNTDKPKCYVLDMFPYPSGAGLHVGHPLGYIATDIYARYKKMKGYNVLHPMGFDSFGLPAEQYAIETGQHPAITTAQNIQTFKKQLAKIGFNHDLSREIQTSSPEYYRWTQWIFQQIFKAWFNYKTQKAEPIDTLIAIFEKEGNLNVHAACDEDTPIFTAQEWNAKTEDEKYALLLKYRLTYLADSVVNWCPALGTVLANDEVKDGLSERGGHPVERKKMKQWMMRITAYAERLLQNLEHLEWSEAIKEMQRNWIGKSTGCEINFQVVGQPQITLTAFTTRIDTIYGATYLALAPEHEVIPQLTTPAQQIEVEKYVQWAKNRSERERQAEVKTISGVFTGSYALNPFTQESIPIWVADYVLAGYGTGVVMGVPSSDDRDFRFAKYFNLPIRCVIEGTEDVENPTEKKYGKMINSGFLNGLETQEAIQKATAFVEQNQLGKAKVNYKMRDAVFSRQRYWGEPVPVYFKNGLPYLIDEQDLPLLLPEIDEYKPTAEGEPPLGRAKNWKYKNEYPYELTTMPGWAGSSWYFLRYMDPHNSQEFASRQATDYWNQVDLYVGGAEHAVGHLLYSRFWTNVLYDLGYISFQEPFKKMINQGMIQGESALIYRLKTENTYVSADLKDQYDTIELHVTVKALEGNNTINIAELKRWRPEDYANAHFIVSKDGKFYANTRIEKLSKRYYNAVNPDDVIEKYSADTLRLYEMFLGPLEQSKPWNTQGIDGTYKFLKRLWRMFYNEKGEWQITEQPPTLEELKILHKTIKKVEEDIERCSFNTPVSAFMICLNELQTLKCHKRAILEPFLQILAPYCPHITEELWHALGHTTSIHHAPFPIFEEKYLQESTFEYPVSINGKTRTKITFPLDLSQEQLAEQVQKHEAVQKWLEGKSPKKVIVVPQRIINIVI
ncbi:MAG: leucine--tRNA ligase [Microscillaceae bacterium]|nr:leucine--tRNA ligase [Microscillaceae bacterium]MDW8345372.1 leucine--tRNA ligase [Bacteroidia bacterium]MDW8460259.1 leucine--tRNA ligase [Cytophagales bacterium]